MRYNIEIAGKNKRELRKLSGLQKQVSMATGILNRLSKMVHGELKLKAYYAWISSKLE